MMNKKQRIYCNSYTQKVSELGSTYSFSQIQLDSASVENIFTNFYQSTRKDFRNFGLVGQQFNCNFVCQQYLTVLTFVQWFNNQLDAAGGNAALYEMIDLTADLPKYVSCLSYKIWLKADHTQFYSGNLVGSGWDKLGFNLVSDPSINFKTQFISQRSMDFTQTPVVLIQIDNLPSSISNGFGTAQFFLPNTALFGDKLFYDSHFLDTCQSIQWGEPISISQLYIRLLNCDQQLLETPINLNQVPNQNNMECAFVFTINNEEQQN